MTPTVHTPSGVFFFQKCSNRRLFFFPQWWDRYLTQHLYSCVTIWLLDFFPFREIPIGETVFPPPWAWKKGRNSPNVNFHNNKILIECCRAHATNICGWFFLKKLGGICTHRLFLPHYTSYYTVERSGKGRPSKQKRKTQQQFLSLLRSYLSLFFWCLPSPHCPRKRKEARDDDETVLPPPPLKSKYVASACHTRFGFPNFAAGDQKKIAPLLFFFLETDRIVALDQELKDEIYLVSPDFFFSKYMWEKGGRGLFRNIFLSEFFRYFVFYPFCQAIIALRLRGFFKSCSERQFDNVIFISSFPRCFCFYGAKTPHFKVHKLTQIYQNSNSNYFFNLNLWYFSFCSDSLENTLSNLELLFQPAFLEEEEGERSGSLQRRLQGFFVFRAPFVSLEEEEGLSIFFPQIAQSPCHRRCGGGGGFSRLPSPPPPKKKKSSWKGGVKQNT